MNQNQKPQQLNTKSEYELKRQRKLREQKLDQRNRTLRRFSKVALIILITSGVLGALVWYIAARQPIPEEEIISRNGLHWHAELAITIKDEKHEIPSNIGIGAVHQPIHTHDSTGAIHLEIRGLVRKEDIKLGRFFKIWDKVFNSNCIFDKCNSPEGKVKMLVNGEENKEFENYAIKGGDKIEIRYE